MRQRFLVQCARRLGKYLRDGWRDDAPHRIDVRHDMLHGTRIERIGEDTLHVHFGMPHALAVPQQRHAAERTPP